jgi:branched-chain amino acid transport system ATP-binding protein
MILQVESVTKKFGGLIAVNNVDLEVEEGEIIGIIGPNGAGKSTLLNLIAGVYKPTSGTIQFNGEKISGSSPERICQWGIARTFQIPRPFSKMSVFENILVATSFGSSTLVEDPHERAREVLDFVGFSMSEETMAGSLNTCQLRRLELARALASRPRVLLLDETGAGLTPNELEDLQTLILKVRDQGVTILIVEHLMRLIMELSNLIAVLHYGVKIAYGTPEEIMNNEEVANAYLGERYLLT